MTDGLLSYYSGQMIACAIWAIPCVLLTLVTIGVIWMRKTPEWQTQTNQMTGMKYTGMRTYLIGVASFWMSGPVLVGLGCTLVHLKHEADDFIAANPWLPTFTLIGAIAVPVTAAVIFGIWWWSKRPAKQQPVQQWQAVPQSPVTPMEPYSRPYGEWADGEQVVR